jgi:hypothetical protein
MGAPGGFSRRAFLARVGVLGAAASGAGGLLLRTDTASGPQVTMPAGQARTDALRRLLAELSRDTFDGLTAFVVPGSDRYSHVQGTPRSEPGALAAHATDFLMESLDNFVPFPASIAQPVTAGLATALSDLDIPLAGGLLDLLPLVDTLDDALGALLASDEAIPLSLVVALLLNLVATQVNPLAVNGLLLSPFARLRYADKAAAFALVEGPDADLVAALDTQLPEPLRASLSGLLRFVGGALMEFPAFGSYGEWDVFDPATRTLESQPVGWRLTGYPGVSDGWDDFAGYYQDRTSVDGG